MNDHLDNFPIRFRVQIAPPDREHIFSLTAATGFFSEAEIAVAVELADDKLANGAESTYRFIFAEIAGQTVGYSCYGPIPCTISSFDLYWIAVHPDFQGRGIGRRILRETEKQIVSSGGTRIYVDTAGREQYRPTRDFYASCGYRQAAVLDHFYAPADAKVIFLKECT